MSAVRSERVVSGFADSLCSLRDLCVYLVNCRGRPLITKAQSALGCPGFSKLGPYCASNIFGKHHNLERAEYSKTNGRSAKSPFPKEPRSESEPQIFLVGDYRSTLSLAAARRCASLAKAFVQHRTAREHGPKRRPVVALQISWTFRRSGLKYRAPTSACL